MPNRLDSKHRAMLASVVTERRFDDDDAAELDGLLWESVSDDVQNYDWPLTDELPRAMYYAATWLEAGVNNGGFFGFFFNQGPKVALYARDFLRECGPASVLDILERAIALMPTEWMTASHADSHDYLPWEDEPVREESLRALDDEFFELDLHTEFAECRLRFAAKHAAAFFAD